MNIRRYIRKIFLGFDIANYFFSECGEDVILQAIFRKKMRFNRKGFFVDVGAYHPYQSSNTYLLYKNGWVGINIDACLGSMTAFNNIRKKDINIEMGISDSEDILTYYYFGENSSYNSFSRENLKKFGISHLVKKEIQVPVVPLSKLLDNYSDKFTTIDLLNIDVEGYDHNVIKSIDWLRHRPSVIVIELECTDINSLQNNITAIFLCNIGYNIVAKNVVLKNLASVIFVDKNFDY